MPATQVPLLAGANLDLQSYPLHVENVIWPRLGKSLFCIPNAGTTPKIGPHIRHIMECEMPRPLDQNNPALHQRGCKYHKLQLFTIFHILSQAEGRQSN